MNIFHEVYASNYIFLITISLFATMVLSLFYLRFSEKKWFKWICYGAVVGYSLVVFCHTVLFRTPQSESYGVVLVPFNSLKYAFQGNEEGFRTCFMNMLLFYPFGCLCFGINKIKKHKGIIYFCIGLLISLLIETLQYIFNLGFAEADDLIFNTLGVIIAYYLCTLFEKIIIDIKNYMRKNKGI
ncbi:MAG: VanZ family protein [Acutalibacteraceae bacterium]